MARSIEGLLARVRHPTLKRMVTFWDEKRRGRDWPLRADFDPLEFWFAVGYVSLIEVISAPGSGARRYFFRLDGTRQVDLFGVDFTGKFLDQVADAEGTRVAEESYGAVVDQGEPQHHVRQVDFHDRPIQYEIAILPLSKTGEGVDMLMTVVTRDEES
ncbi:PAS domain-containing protein [Dongia sedimenti]|uniref:PAS domain-containing protein n=1 Tax=Dongia sedimenti TaxID=3064282 RepID=A0ABU0YT06_9PROT|nr:PAS domain-containing protein [Rhodospirillaceae bacterium R-7]